MTNTYNNQPMSQDQINQARRILQRDGWEYVEDTIYPVTDSRRIGWWINPSHESKCRRTGDSKPYSYATETTYRLYSGHSDNELS